MTAEEMVPDNSPERRQFEVGMVFTDVEELEDHSRSQIRTDDWWESGCGAHAGGSVSPARNQP
ncbi:MAG: hypothetical protein JWN03_3702 [Nocardia sp.]|nr:hypothetical protein [Nocardia sp.]